MLSELNSTPNPKGWWNQFPPKLRLIARGRLFASIGAGGVLYLSPLLFNELGFSASQIGSGITIAAISGTISRLITGLFLDKGVNCFIPLRIAGLFAILADLVLLNSNQFSEYLQGQFLLGAAAGIYWPSAELSVPIHCEEYPSSKGFALVRTADALGITIGSILGTLSSSFGILRSIYLLDILCMLFLIRIVSKKILNVNYNKQDLLEYSFQGNRKNLIIKLFPILIISLFSTSIFALLQSGLPLDLVQGSPLRPALNESISGLILSLQLGLILLFQWPIGKYLSNKNVMYGLRLSLTFLGIGCLFLSLSSKLTHGIYLIIIALISIAIGLTSFLPTATEGIVQASSKSNRGIAMALFSQCFGISAVIAPITAGKILDHMGDGFTLWLSLAIISFCLIPLNNNINLMKSK